MDTVSNEGSVDSPKQSPRAERLGLSGRIMVRTMSNKDIAGTSASPRSGTPNSPRSSRIKSLSEVQAENLASVLEELRSTAILVSRKPNPVNKRTLLDMVEKIDKLDGYMTARGAMADPIVSKKLLAHVTEDRHMDWVTFWMMVDEFERSDPALRMALGARIVQKYVTADALGLDAGRRAAVENAYVPGLAPPETLFDTLKMDVEDLVDQHVMPGFLTVQKGEKLMGSSKTNSIRKGVVGRNNAAPARDLAQAMEQQNAIAALKAELHDVKEQSDAWKASYVNAKEQLQKSERVLQKLLESYRKDEAEIVKLRKELKEFKAAKSKDKPGLTNRIGLGRRSSNSDQTLRPLPPPPSPTPTPSPGPERNQSPERNSSGTPTLPHKAPAGLLAEISGPVLLKKPDDSTPLALGEIDKYALMRTRTAKDFHVHAVLGNGNYGVVFLATETAAKRVLAVKRMNKNVLIDRNQVLTIMTEALVMKEASAGNSPWLVQLHYAWNDPNYLYLAMDFCVGGDLRSVLENVELDEAAVRFFAAEMIQAVHALHRHGYVHRDLKPDNFLLHRSGHIKLADFGLSKAGYELDAAAAESSNKKIMAQAMRVFVEVGAELQHTHFTIIVNSTTLVGDVVAQTMNKMLHRDPTKEYLLYEEGSSGGACFLKELQVATPLSQVTAIWEETRAELPGSDMRFRLVLKEKQGQVRDFARRKNMRYNRKTMVGGNVSRAIRDPYYKAPQMSKREKLYSVVGTPSYMAREILEGEGYEAVVDWWSIGCIMYEMLVGELPFSGSTPEELFQAVLNSEETLSFPESLSQDAQDIVRRFLSPPKERLGYSGVQEIHGHSFFSSIDWANLHNAAPPFVPEVDGDFDLSYFDKARTEKIPSRLDEPLPMDDCRAIVYDPFAKSDWNFSIRN